MELGIIKKEIAGNIIEAENLTRFEIMDGAPTKGEIVPIRFYLSSTDLTPSYKNVNNKFSCRYFLNLQLQDDEDRKYFK